MALMDQPHAPHRPVARTSRRSPIATLGAVLALPLALSAAACAGVDYFLINGGAESGALTGWGKSPSSAPIEATTHVDETAGTVEPQAGDYLFSFAGAPQSGTISLFQGAPMEPGTASLRFSGWCQTEFADVGEVIFSALDESGGVLTSQSTGALNTPNLAWHPFEVSIQVPGNAATWRVELRGTRVTGTFVNVFYDSMLLSFGVVGDLNFDGSVDGSDLGLLLASWGACPGGAVCLADLNGDGTVDGSDLGLLLAAWS